METRAFAAHLRRAIDESSPEKGREETGNEGKSGFVWVSVENAPETATFPWCTRRGERKKPTRITRNEIKNAPFAYRCPWPAVMLIETDLFVGPNRIELERGRPRSSNRGLGLERASASRWVVWDIWFCWYKHFYFREISTCTEFQIPTEGKKMKIGYRQWWRTQFALFGFSTRLNT